MLSTTRSATLRGSDAADVVDDQVGDAVFRPVAVVTQHVQQHELGHPGGKPRVDDARDRHAGRQLARISQQVIDAGAKREDCPQIGVAQQVARLWLPE